MDEADNPFVPGAGTPPPLLVGRDKLVHTAEIALSRAKNGRHGKSFVAVGLRGVGKTVVLNKVRRHAEDNGFQVVYIEAQAEESLVALLAPQLRSILININRLSAAGDLADKALGSLRNFANALKISIGEIGIEFDFASVAGQADSGNLANDLPELFVAVGKAAAEANTAVVILVDEIQYLPDPEISALVMAIHRVNQYGLPTVMIGAGLPQILGKMGDAKSYAERLFDFPRVEALSRENSHKAIAEPAREQDVVFLEPALDAIFALTEGYPYFLQEWAFVAWNAAEQSPIGLDVIDAAKPEAIRRLDESFFRVRLERMTPRERQYMLAMAQLGPGPHASGDIAKQFGARVQSVAPTRSNLIGKGMLYSPSHGSTYFTVPLFDEFLRREMADADK